MCNRCDKLKETQEINEPPDYYRIIEETKSLLAKGILLLVEGNADLEKIKPGVPWPNDFITHIFRCAACQQQFKLFVETYHGSGGTWEAITD
jgi:hypothetical protein